MHTEIITTPGGFETLRAEWDALSARAVHRSVFTSWEWQSIWWQHYGGDQPLRIVAVREAAGGRLLGLLPLYVQTRHVLRVFRLRVLRNVGTGGDTAPDYLDPLVDPEHAEAASRALARAVAERVAGWDMLNISDLVAESAFSRHLQQACEARGWQTQRKISAHITYAQLPANWETFLKNSSTSHRQATTRERRRFEELPGAAFGVWKDPATLDKAIDSLIELHLMRWRDRGQAHSFSNPRYIAFHRSVMHACLKRDHLRLYYLETEGRLVAVYYCYRFGDGIFFFQSGFDPSFGKLSLGSVLMGYAFDHAMQEGLAVFDMLRGDYSYKSSWAKSRRETFAIESSRRTLSTLMFQLRHDVLPRIKRKLVSIRQTLAPATQQAAGAAQEKR